MDNAHLPVKECAYRYPDGRRCRRIPKRGETLCRDHKRGRRLTRTEDPAFTRQMEAYADRLITLPLDVLAAEVQFALSAMHPIFDSRFSRTWRLLFNRAEIAVAALAEELPIGQTPPAPPPRHCIPQCLPARTAESNASIASRGITPRMTNGRTPNK